MNNCLFCKIVRGEIPATKVYEDENVLGFKDITPQAPIHYLFIPKEHFTSLAEVPLEKMSIMEKLFAAVKKTAAKEGLEAGGFRNTINTGKEGGQSVFHLHVHLFARKQMGANMVGT